MSAQQAREKMREERRRQKFDRVMAKLGNPIGDIIDNMIFSGIVDQFRELGYGVTQCGRSIVFGVSDSAVLGLGGFDFHLVASDTTIFFAVRIKLTIDGVMDQIDQLKKHRQHLNAGHGSPNRNYIGAVAGAVVEPNVADFAQKQGMYVTVQSGEAVEILPPPEGFVVKTW